MNTPPNPPGLLSRAYIIQEYQEPTNQRRSGHWVEIARLDWTALRRLPALWASLPGRKRLVAENESVICSEDFGQTLEIVIDA